MEKLLKFSIKWKLTWKLEASVPIHAIKATLWTSCKISRNCALIGHYFAALLMSDIPFQSLHKKLSSPLRISSVNVIKSAGNCRFGHIYWRNP